MKYIALAAALVAVSACSPAETEEDTGADAMAVEDQAIVEQPMAADGMPTPGTYEVTNAAGEVTTEVLNEDGTYVSTNADGTTENGTWEQRSPGEYCAKAESAEEMTCYSESVDENGVWSSIDPNDGEVSTVVRVDAQS
ncbi:hypothetical protein [Erythrobacter sp. MTPC3]|uniref:hypothetical protein n=1 Tax=Erythrobacter sp. MTPC3 TaxID=3056564 RepID=UPI0036F38D44